MRLLGHKSRRQPCRKGLVTGHTVVDYKLCARAGLAMNVSLKTSDAINYFNVLPPGASDVAILVGSTSGSVWSGTLPDDGEYAVRVYP